MIDLRNSLNRKEVAENENPKKEVNTVEKTLNFKKEQKGKEINILTHKKMLQRFQQLFRK